MSTVDLMPSVGQENGLEHPLRALCAGWLSKIRLAMEFKKAHFQDDADEAMRFLCGPENWFWEKRYMTGKRGYLSNMDGDESVPQPQFRMNVNKTAEMQQLFGPSLYRYNPHRQVNPKQNVMLPPAFYGDPMTPEGQMAAGMAMQQQQMGDQVNFARAALISQYINYTPNELNLEDHVRRMIDDAILKGMGVVWTEVYQPKGFQTKLVGSFHDPIENLVLDPDACALEECTWVARRCVHPVWQVEDEYGLPRGSLKGKGSFESLESQGESEENEKHSYERMRGKSNDLLVYWKVYSKMGMGDRLSGVKDHLGGAFDQFGDYCFLVVAKDIPYPLNLHSQRLYAAMESGMLDDVFSAVQWPIPFWADDEWPFTYFAPHVIPGRLWPMSHLKPAMGELKFMQWANSFMATKVRTACRDFVAVVKSAEDDFKQKIMEGRDFTLLEIESIHGKSIQDVVSFLQHPPFHPQIREILEMNEANFDKRTGMPEILYGQASSQSRSATDVNVRQQNASIRVEDMSRKLERQLTMLARKEALAARWMLDPEDVALVLGPHGAQAWSQLVMSSDVESVVREFDYRIESGSSRIPNKDTKVQQVTMAVQTWGPILQGFAQMGQVQPLNALMEDWGREMEYDTSRYQIQPPMLPPPEGEQDAVQK